uniref:Reverse transcriptase domain-containing protein n=1 Tax=Oryza brachyantha TaxID=4533 RepID=J3L168_ORYBR
MEGIDGGGTQRLPRLIRLEVEADPDKRHASAVDSNRTSQSGKERISHLIRDLVAVCCEKRRQHPACILADRTPGAGRVDRRRAEVIHRIESNLCSLLECMAQLHLQLQAGDSVAGAAGHSHVIEMPQLDATSRSAATDHNHAMEMAPIDNNGRRSSCSAADDKNHVVIDIDGGGRRSTSSDDDTPSCVVCMEPLEWVAVAAKMDGLISNAQSAFIKRQCIQDSFVYVRNVARLLQSRSKPTLFFELDIANAFDTITWDYLLEGLRRRGFSARRRDWICLLLSMATSTINLNIIDGEPIKHTRGLRQGDPVSPYLFILAIDPLHRILDRATELGLLSPLACGAATCRVSLYADDAAIFLNPTKEDTGNLFQLLQNFGDVTGLWVNLAKSSVVPIRCANIDLTRVLDSFDGKLEQFPINYLGLPLTPGRINRNHLQSILYKIKKRMAGWKREDDQSGWSEDSDKCGFKLYTNVLSDNSKITQANDSGY